MSPTTATILNASKKTWTSAGLAELRRKAGLVAGAIADFQAAGGLVAVKTVEYEPGKTCVKVFLVAENLNVKSQRTADGIDLVVETYHQEPTATSLVAESEKP